ncbi:MAG TPA: carbohydrate ABC transporter permease [Bauldia sp.]|nr:carbohydrate ABC transporter permease [Bauldia sp.]
MRSGPGVVLRYPAAAAVVAFFLLPVAYLVSLSFKTKDDVLSGHFLPTEPTLANWPGAFAAAPLTGFIVNSTVVALLAGLLTVAIAVPGAYAVTRLGIGRKWLPQAVLSGYMAPSVVALIPLFFFFKSVGLINSLAGLVLVNGLANLPVAWWLLTPFLTQVPREIEEAATLDGCGPVRTLVSIVVPVISPGLAATTIIVIILAYNEFLFASAFAFSDATRTLTVGISLFQGDRLINLGQMAVASLAGVVPIYGLALVTQRWLVRGISQGAIK